MPSNDKDLIVEEKLMSSCLHAVKRARRGDLESTQRRSGEHAEEIWRAGRRDLERTERASAQNGVDKPKDSAEHKPKGSAEHRNEEKNGSGAMRKVT